MTILADKSTLRADVLHRRAALGPQVRHDLAQRLARTGPDIVMRWCARSHPHPPVASVFHPVRGEADTLPLFDTLVATRVATALPVTVASARPLRFLAWRPGEPLRRNTFGVLEPLPDAQDLVPDVLFVPLAAFDRRGFRLGYGAGYYDATLVELRRRKPVLAVGVAFSIQEVEAVPAEPHDERLDAVLTELGVTTFGAE